MNSISPSNDSLIEIATFLARRWSNRDSCMVQITSNSDAIVQNRDKIILTALDKRSGDSFERYRQFRVSLWYEAMRSRYCEKVLSSDHAFGFILNTMETRRIELLGRQMWRGMDSELVFNYSVMLSSRPRLRDVYGRARIVEAFYQQFMFGVIKGEIQPSHLERVHKAADLATDLVQESLGNIDTRWLEHNTNKIVKILDIDSLLTIPISLPYMRSGMPLNEEELRKNFKIITRDRENDWAHLDPNDVISGRDVYDEYTILVNENKKTQNLGLGQETIGVQTPSAHNVDESIIYDITLINGLKTRFKEWKTGWSERHLDSGDEFDAESYIDGHEPFFTDIRRSIKTKITILLDHSSSIAADSLEYKKATLALCEVLSFLRVDFSVYAFSTQDRAVVCWSIKPDNTKWNSIAAKRLAQIVANGSTPLAEVYDKMYDTLQAKRPDIFLTLTDGEPSDPDAVRNMTKQFKGLGIKMLAMGMGPSTIRATTIANNLRHLGYERTVAVSRLADIPDRVISILDGPSDPL